MEPTQPVQPQIPQPQVGFPAPQDTGEKKGGMFKWVVVIVGLIVIVVAGIFFIMSSSSGSSNTTSTSDTNSSGSLSTFPTPEVTSTPTPTPTATPEPVDKSKIKVEVLNGTGTPGDAGLAKSAIEDLGYENVEASNAEEQSETDTTITYSRDLDQATIDELVTAIEKVFSTVKTRRGTIAGDFDIRVLTGDKK